MAAQERMSPGENPRGSGLGFSKRSRRLALVMRAACGALVLLAGCAAAPRPAVQPVASTLRYQVRFDPAGALQVEVRGFGPDERSWRFARRGRARDLELQRGDGWEPFEVAPGGPEELPAGVRALRYVYDLIGGDLTAGAGTEGGYLVDGRAYLLRPDRLRGDRRVEASFFGGSPVVVPWDLGSGVAHLEGRDLWDPGFHTFGVEPEPIELPGGTLELLVLPSAERPPPEELRAWIEQAGRELLTARAELPYPRTPVTLVPLPGQSDASPFGKVLMSRPPTVALYVGGRARGEDFAADWVAVHELFHLAEPRFRPGVAWLSEGIATYYQGLARLRSGRLPSSTAWRYLREGVRRGQAQARGRSLLELSERMHELRAYQAVYWGGALFALELDLELRRRAGGEGGLDALLEELLAAGSEATLEGFARAVDRAAGAPLWAELEASHLEGPALGSAGRLLGRLGLGGQGRWRPNRERSVLEGR
jgi:hypothetical protein